MRRLYVRFNPKADTTHCHFDVRLGPQVAERNSTVSPALPDRYSDLVSNARHGFSNNDGGICPRCPRPENKHPRRPRKDDSKSGRASRKSGISVIHPRCRLRYRSPSAKIFSLIRAMWFVAAYRLVSRRLEEALRCPKDP